MLGHCKSEIEIHSCNPKEYTFVHSVLDAQVCIVSHAHTPLKNE